MVRKFLEINVDEQLRISHLSVISNISVTVRKWLLYICGPRIVPIYNRLCRGTIAC